VLPTLLTLGNGVCGFAAIAYASKIGRTDVAGDSASYFAISGWLILAAMVFDALDGYVARLTKTASKFGGELDSLCDAISFGAARCLASLGILRGELPAKLAAYWQETDVAGLTKMVQAGVESWAVLGTVLVALLMVSAIPYPHVTKNILRGKRHFGHLMQVIL